MTIIKRLERLSIPEPNSGCVLWLGHLTSGGYGRITIRPVGKSQYAHRVAYEAMVGPIPDGLQIDHLCRNRACINPAHLEPVTHAVNTLRGNGACAQHARKTHCKHGHPFDEANTRISPTGERRCRACARAAYHRSYQKTGRPVGRTKKANPVTIVNEDVA